MKAGKFDHKILERSILKHARRKTHGVKEGAGHGIDALISEDGRCMAEGTASSEEPLIPGTMVGELAVIRAINNLSTACDKLSYISMTLFTGTDVSEDVIRNEMLSVENTASSFGVSLVHGDSRVFGMIEPKSYIISINAYGLYKEQIDNDDESVPDDERKRIDTVSGISANDRIVLAGYTGLYDAVTGAYAKKEELSKIFSSELLCKLLGHGRHFCCIDTCRYIRSMVKGIYMHDVSEGGLYRALYDMSVYAGLGIDVLHDDIPMLQEIIEIAEYEKTDPYTMNGMGCVLAAVPESNVSLLITGLKEKGIPAADIGSFTKDKSKVIRYNNGEMQRYITP